MSVTYHTNRSGIDLYRTLVAIRHFEEIAIELYNDGLFGGSYHSSVGQEAVAAGVCSALDATDGITTTYRGRGQHVAKGADPFRLYAEMLGRTEGYCSGKGGPMHITDRETGILGANGIVGAGVPIAAGAALAAQLDGSDRVAVAFFGDGALNQGVFSETLNLAALWNLPLILVCENNLYAEMTALHLSVKNTDLSGRVAGFGIPAEKVDGNDVDAVRSSALAAVKCAREGGGPTFIEALTYRIHGHMMTDKQNYRTKEEVASWEKKDPLIRYADQLIASGQASASDLRDLEARVEGELRAASSAACNLPEPGPETIETDVY